MYMCVNIYIYIYMCNPSGLRRGSRQRETGPPTTGPAAVPGHTMIVIIEILLIIITIIMRTLILILQKLLLLLLPPLLLLLIIIIMIIIIIIIIVIKLNMLIIMRRRRRRILHDQVRYWCLWKKAPPENKTCGKICFQSTKSRGG